ncbi:hypothetical protein DFJ73DRAFT_823287 [Zopfochytrium polystomum]|nr:hypothetical protein DFJ73DRAFT_823287 [Zopfochytrium polystomum]
MAPKKLTAAPQHSSFSAFVEYIRRTTPDAASFLSFAKTSPLCKVVSTPVSPTVLPPSIFVNPVLHDIKVNPAGLRDQRGGGRRPRGPSTDDDVYKRSATARRRIARGNTVLTFDRILAVPGISPEPVHGPLACVVIWALKKFTGGIGDEDDDEKNAASAPSISSPAASPAASGTAGGAEAEEVSSSATELAASPGGVPVWHRFFVRDPETATSVAITAKANGAAGHLSVLEIGLPNLPRVWIGGSKNVHLVVRSKADLSLYQEPGRFNVAVKVVEAALDAIEAAAAGPDAIAEALWTRHATACFELLDPADAHVEDLSFMQAPELHMYSLVCFEKGVVGVVPDDDSTAAPQTDGYICEPPVETLALFARLGLKTVSLETRPLEPPAARAAAGRALADDQRLADVCAEIRAAHGVEGSVLYFLDAAGDVVGMLKKKSVWYIVVRAVREKLKAYEKVGEPAPAPAASAAAHGKRGKRPAANVNADADAAAISARSVCQRAAPKLRARMRDIATWLGWSEAEKGFWTDLSVAANEWVAAKMEAAVTAGEKPENAGLHFADGRFPEMWTAFVRESGKEDRYVA